MLLSVPERFRMLELLAKQQTNIITLGVIRRLNEKIDFSLEEQEELGIQQDPTSNRVLWKAGPDIPRERDVDFSEKEIKFIAGLLKRSNGLSIGYLSLLEKFGVKIPEEGEE